jgi:hypothetical protein
VLRAVVINKKQAALERWARDNPEHAEVVTSALLGLIIYIPVGE